jgi:hypothetical protein
MAKAKTSAVKPKVLRGRPKSARKAMKTLGYRVTPDYLDWLGTVASANRTSIVACVLAHQALAPVTPSG